MPAANKKQPAEKSSDKKKDLATDNYAPSPWEFFLVHYKNGVQCNICMSSILKLNAPSAAVSDCTPALLACGHLFGRKCLDEWLADPNSRGRCPACRKNVKYTLCGHVVPPRNLDLATVHLVKTPPCLGEGKVEVDSQCLPCRLDCSAKLVMENIEDQLKILEEVREGKRSEEEGEKAKKLLETLGSAFVPPHLYTDW